MLTTLQMPFTFFTANVILLIYVIYKFICSRKASNLKHYGIFLVVQFLLGSFYFLPSLVSPVEAESLGHYQPTYESIELLSKRNYVYPLLGFPPEWISKLHKSWLYYSSSVLQGLQFFVSLTLLAIIPFSILLFKKIKERYLAIFFGATLLILWQLSLGSIGIFGELYKKLATEYTIFNFLRSSSKFYVFIPFAILGMLGIAFSTIKKPKSGIVFSGIFLACMMFVVFPSIISWNNNLKPIQVPNEFDKVQNIILDDFKNDNEYFRTIWIPNYSEYITETTWAIDKKISSFDQRSSKIPIYSYFYGGYRQLLTVDPQIYGFIGSKLLDNQTYQVARYLNLLGIKYVIFHDDVEKNQYKTMLNNLLSANKFELVYHENFMYLFKNKIYEPREYFQATSEKPVMLESFYLQNSVLAFDNFVKNYILLDDQFSEDLNVVGNSDKIVMNDFDDTLSNLIYHRMPEYFYSPGEHTFHRNLAKYWSVATGWDLPQATFNSMFRQVYRGDFNEYQLDFGRKLVITNGSAVTGDYFVEVNSPGQHVVLLRYFANRDGGEMELQLDNIGYTISTRAEADKLCWKELGTVDLAEGTHTIKLNNIRGFNAVNVIGVVPIEIYQQVREKIVSSISSNSVTYIVEGEHLLNRTGPTTVEKWNGASNAKVLMLGAGSTVWHPLNILSDGNYEVLVRYIGENGTATLSFGEKNLRLDFTGNNNFKFREDAYRIHLTNQDNAFSILVEGENQLILHETFNQEFNIRWSRTSFKQSFENNRLRLSTSSTENKTWSWLRSQDIPVTPGIYSAEVLMKYANAKGSHVKIEGHNTISGKWDSDFAFVARGVEGSSDWERYTKVFYVPPEVDKIRLVLNAGWVSDNTRGDAITWFDDVKLFRGGIAIDVVILAPSNENTTFENRSASSSSVLISEWKKLSDGKYNVQVSSSEPFLLSFAESYSPLWRAYVNGKEYKSIPLYAIINGFWIEETGEITITIEYEPQRWFYYGSVVSFLTLIGCVLYLTKRPLYGLISKIRKLKLTSIKSLRKRITR
jgi:hypothetical protein